MIRRKGRLWYCDPCEAWINAVVNGFRCPYCGHEPVPEVVA
jgi:hypothetical protein